MAVIKLLPDAKQELKGSAEWHDGPEAGVREGTFASAVHRCLSLIAEAPERWPLYPVRRRLAHPVRRYVMQDYPYLLPYYVRGDTVVVVAVSHTSRRPGYWLDRLS